MGAFYPVNGEGSTFVSWGMNLKNGLKLLAVPLCITSSSQGAVSHEPPPDAEHAVCRLGNAKGPMKDPKPPSTPKKPPTPPPTPAPDASVS